jgi:hypothetical protein
MTSFVTFNFICGNFTSGHGYYYGSNSSNDALKERLENNGERNCQIIMQQKNLLDDDNKHHHRYSTEFEYRVTSRWYTSLASTAFTAAPFVLPYIMTGIKRQETIN